MGTLSAGLAFALAIAASPATASMSRQLCIEDLRYLRSGLQSLHAGLNRYSTPAEVEKAFETAEQGLGERVEARELFVAVASLSKVIRDGHTRFRYSVAMEDAADTWPLLPLQVELEGERLHVVHDCSASGSLANRELLAVDGVPASALIERILALRPRDGWNKTGPRWALGRSFALSEALAVIYGPRPSWQVQLSSGQGPESVSVQGRPRRLLQGCESAPVSRPAGLQFLDGGRAAELVIPSFVTDLAADYRAWFESLARHRTEALVIDMRDNGGGLDRNGSLLFAHLTRTPFRYYDAITVNTLHPPPPFDGFAELLKPWRIQRDSEGRLQFTGHSCLGTQNPAAPAFDGAVVVLVNGGTFSAASEFAAVAAARGRATFVGEETGGAANGNTAGVSAELTLPYSGIRVQVPMMRYDVAAPGLPHGRGVVPHLEVRGAVRELVAGRDAARERGLALARSKLTKEDE